MYCDTLLDQNHDSLINIIPPEHKLPPQLIKWVQHTLANGASVDEISDYLTKRNLAKSVIGKLLDIAPEFKLGDAKIFQETIISEAWCDNIIQKIKKFDAQQAQVYEKDNNNQNQKVMSSDRVAELVDFSPLKNEICEVINQSLVNHCQDYFNVVFEAFQYPQLLRYQQGGMYKHHSDSGYFGGHEGIWMQTLNRDISYLCYLDEDYQGGELHFLNFDLKIKPRKGTVIAFPSHYIYQHGVLPVTSGERHVIVSWTLVKGSKRVDSSPSVEWVKVVL